MNKPLADQLGRAVTDGNVDACLAAEEVSGLPRGILLALALHETGLGQTTREGRHGVFGIDPRRHADWLAEQGGTPTTAEAATFVAGLLTDAATFGRANGVADQQLLKFAVSAYHAGPEAALAGYRRSEPAGGRYATELLARLPGLQRWLEARLGGVGRPRLEPGATGQAVVELKRLIRDWYTSLGVAPPRRMRGPVYGTAAVEAVKAFQETRGITPDGVVGKETWTALSKLRDDRSAA